MDKNSVGEKSSIFFLSDDVITDLFNAFVNLNFFLEKKRLKSNRFLTLLKTFRLVMYVTKKLMQF